MDIFHPADTFETRPFEARQDRELIEKIAEYTERYLGSLAPGWEKTEGEIHRLRRQESLLWIADLVSRHGLERPLILGQTCLFDWTMGHAGILPWHRLTFTEFDLRYPFPLEDDAFDFVISTEVLEHLKDPEESDRALFLHKGAMSSMAECFRVLEPGGRLFLTTPNICSAQAIARLLDHRTAFEWSPHVREYSPGELLALFLENGFEIEAFDSRNVYQTRPASDQISALLEAHGYSEELRGDTFFVIARKPPGKVS